MVARLAVLAKSSHPEWLAEYSESARSNPQLGPVSSPWCAPCASTLKSLIFGVFEFRFKASSRTARWQMLIRTLLFDRRKLRKERKLHCFYKDELVWHWKCTSTYVRKFQGNNCASCCVFYARIDRIDRMLAWKNLRLEIILMPFNLTKFTDQVHNEQVLFFLTFHISLRTGHFAANKTLQLPTGLCCSKLPVSKVMKQLIPEHTQWFWLLAWSPI